MYFRDDFGFSVEANNKCEVLRIRIEHGELFDVNYSRKKRATRYMWTVRGGQLYLS